MVGGAQLLLKSWTRPHSQEKSASGVHRIAEPAPDSSCVVTENPIYSAKSVQRLVIQS